MGLIDSAGPATASLQGLHLYHTAHSNCAGRVRLLLEEKGLPWISHNIDLQKKENISAEYFTINPKGLVPTLVHNGQVVVESNDILLYVEERYPTPGFTPTLPEQLKAMHAWLKRSTEIHVPGIKTYIYANLDPALTERSAEQAARYRSLQKDAELLAFHAKHDAGRRFSVEDTNEAVALLHAAFSAMEAEIARTGWLAGEAYSLADISWAPSIAMLQRVNFPLRNFPSLLEWYARIAQRPAWTKAMRLG